MIWPRGHMVLEAITFLINRYSVNLPIGRHHTRPTVFVQQAGVRSLTTVRWAVELERLAL